MPQDRWVNPKKIPYRERMDRRLERAGLLNYQTQGLSAQEIADRYARAGITIAKNTSWFQGNYGFEAPEYITDRQKMYEYRNNPQAYLPNVFPTLQPKIVPAGGKADRPQNFMVGTDPITGKTAPTIVPLQQGQITNANSPYAPMVFGTPEQAQQGEIGWANVSTTDRQKVLSDPNFYKSGQIAQFPLHIQQEILADPNFKWDELDGWQRAYYSASSNPAAMGATQGALMGFTTGGKFAGIGGAILGSVLGYAAGVSGYDPSKEAWEQGDKRFTFDKAQGMEFVRGAFGYLNWAAEQAEKAIGLGVQAGATIANRNKYGDLGDVFTREGYDAGSVVFENMAQQISGSQDILMGALQSGDPLGYLEELHAAAPKGSVLEKMMLGAIGYVAKPTDYMLGATDKVQVDDSNFLERMTEIRERIKRGENYREVMLEMQGGIAAQVADMAGQAIADPLNVVGRVEAKAGEVTARVTGDKIAQAAFAQSDSILTSGYFDAQQRLRNIINTPGEAAKIDPNFNLNEMGWLTKRMAGLTSDGNISAGRFSDQGLLDYTPPKRNLRGFVERLTTLTPESRARTGQDMLVRNMGGIMASWFGGQDVDGFYKWWKGFANGDMTQAAELSNRLVQSPEFYTVLPAAKGFDIEGSYTKWTATEQPRQVITRIAEMLGENPQTLIDDLAKKGTAEQDFVRVQDRLRAMDTPDAKALLAEMEAGRLTPDMLADAVKIFSDGEVPFHPAQWMAQTLDEIKNHYDQWAIQNFKLDEESRKTLFRLSGVMKSAQSVLLLGANPGYMLQNVLNTTVTRAFDGVWGYMTPAAIDKFMARMGFDLDAGLAPSRLDEAGPKIQDIQRGEKDAILEAVKGKGALSKTQDAIQRVARVMPFNKLSRVLEGYEGRQGYIIGIKKFMGEGWKRGKGFRNLTEPLAQELNRVMGLGGADAFYSAIEGAMNKQELQNIVSSVGANLQSRSLIHQAAQELNVSSSRAAGMLEQMGILDAIDAATRNANSESRIRAAYDRAKRTAKVKLDEQAAADSVAMIEHIANRLQVEGPKALTDIFIDTEAKGIENWMQHYERMGEAADAMDAIENPNTRSNLWSYNYAESNAEFRRFNAMRGATYLGVMKALGMSENPTARRLLATLADTDRTIDTTYRQMRDLRDGHFKKWNNDWQNPRRQAERTSIERQINELWAATTKKELENSRQFGELLGQQYQDLFGIEAGEAARQAWAQITAFRQEMTSRRDAFRMSIEGMPYAMRQIESKKFWGETYKYMIVEMERIKTEAIRELDRIVNKRRPGGDATPPQQPTQPPPDQPPAAPSVDDMARLRQQAQERQAAADAHLNGIIETAEEFGYTARDQYRLIASLNKYGDIQFSHYDDPRLTPDYVRETLTKRAEIKAEQQARMEANAAEIALSQVEQDTISRPRNEIQESLSDAMMLEAQRIADVVLGGEPGKRQFAGGEFIGATASTYPKWYNDLKASVGGRKKLLTALDKIVKDAGVDKGVVVGRVKEFLLANLKYGDAETNNPPNISVLKDLGADEAVLVKATDDFNIMMGTDFTLEQLLAGDYSSAFDGYFDGAMQAATAFDADGWTTRMFEAYEQADFDSMVELIEQVPPEVMDTPYSITESYGEYIRRVWDETEARVKQDAEDMAIAENQVRSEEAIREQEAEAETGFTRQQFRESLTEIFKLSDDMADAVMDITDARANAYGDAAEWYRTRIAEVVGAGDDPQLFQREKQAGMFAAGEDTPLFSGAAQRATDETYTPRAADRQETMFDMRPKFGGEEPKGGVRFMEDGRAIIRAFGNADVSTVIHEVGHIFRRDLQGVDLATVEAWADVKNGNWTRQAEEKFARGFEKYLADGSAPTPKLRAVFDKFKAWMADVYRAITGSPIDVDLTPQVKEVFDRLLTGEGARRVDVGDMLMQMGYDPKAYFMDYDGTVRRRPELNIPVDRGKTARAIDQLLNKDFMEKAKALKRTSEPVGEFVDTKMQAPDRKTPAWQMSYEEYKALLLQDQREYASRRLAALEANELNEMGADYIRTETAKMKKWLERDTLALERYGDVREKYRQSIERALLDEQPVPDEIKQAFYEMGKPGELSAAERQRLGQAGRGVDELFQMAEPTDSPAFRRWFGDSKVVDENGQPMVVYHGTKADFQVFDIKKAGASDPGLVGKAFYFTPSTEQAGQFASSPHYGSGKKQTVMPVYTKIENPYYIRDGILPDGRSLTDVFPRGIEAANATKLKKDIQRLGYDGIIFTLDGEIVQIAVYQPEQIKSVNNRGTWDPNDPNILFQDADPRMPLGGYEEASGWRADSEGMNELWAQEINPLLDKMQDVAIRRLNEPTLDGAYRDMSAEGQDMMRQYLKGVEQDLASTKMAATRWGQTKRDQSLLNYNRRYGIDQYLDVGFPYQFFYTRSMITWAMRAMDNPAWVANYARLRRQQDRYENNLPERLRGKMRIDAPWMPDWMGDALYIDPLSMLFTPHAMMRPFEQMAKDNNMQMIEAERILQEWAQAESVPMEQLQEAATNRSGKVWEQAVAEAKMRRDAEISNPMDFISATFGPAWYLTTPAKLLGIGKDGPETLTETPLTRTSRAFETVTQDTWMEPAGKLIGLLAKPEEYARKALNLPEMGEYGDYYIDRMLANMVAENRISTEDAIIAMVEREGPLFEEARERVKLELAVRVPFMGATYAALHEGPVEGLKALPASLFGSGLLPEGELEYRGLKQEWNDAWKLKDAGDDAAINRFFAEHPEYEAYLAKGKEPEDRLRSFLIGQIWDGYMELGETDRKTARSAMGEEFANAFLNSETRAYDTLDVTTLTQWAQMLTKRVPTTPQTLPAIEAPRTINFYSPEITQVTDTYYEQRRRMYPDYFELERKYFALPKSQQRSYLVANPTLKQYWDWKRSWYNRYPELVPVFNGQVFKTVDTSNWNSLLVQSVQMYAMMGQPLSAGAWKALEQQWIQAGRPRGNMKDWLEIDVSPAMLYQGVTP